MGLLEGLDFETFYQEADMLMALRGMSLSDIKAMTFDEFLIALETMYHNQPRVVRWLGRFF